MGGLRFGHTVAVSGSSLTGMYEGRDTANGVKVTVAATEGGIWFLDEGLILHRDDCVFHQPVCLRTLDEHVTVTKGNDMEGVCFLWIFAVCDSQMQLSGLAKGQHDDRAPVSDILDFVCMIANVVLSISIPRGDHMIDFDGLIPIYHGATQFLDEGEHPGDTTDLLIEAHRSYCMPGYL